MLLANAFARRFADDLRRPAKTFTDEAMRALELHTWPGNVRELLNKIKRATIMADGSRIGCEDMGLPAGDVGNSVDKNVLDLRTIRDDAERAAVVMALARSNGNIAKASQLLGVSRPSLYDLMDRLAIRQS